MDEIKVHFAKYMIRYLLLMFAVALLFGFALNSTGAMYEISDSIKYYGFTLTIFAISLGAAQFKSAKDWGKRQLAITTMKTIKDSTIDEMLILNDAFNYIHLNSKTSISVDEIHRKICRLNPDGNLYRDDDGHYRLAKDGDGKIIKRAINKVLSDYEYVAVGIYQNVFDKEIVKVLYKGALIKAYHNFKDYIDHVNNDMQPERKGKIWINFVTLAKEFESDETANADKRKETGV